MPPDGNVALSHCESGRTSIRKIEYRRHRFPSEIVSHAVWLYCRFSLSFRDAEDLLADRGVKVSYEINAEDTILNYRYFPSVRYVPERGVKISEKNDCYPEVVIHFHPHKCCLVPKANTG
jgi:hypothetical protein